MLLRRASRRFSTLAVGVTLLALAALTSCGFSAQTDHINTINNGVSNRDASVDVLSAVIVSAEDGSGTLIASFVNNDRSESNTVDEVVGTDQEQQVTAKSFSPIQVEPNSLVNLANPDSGAGPVELTGQFAAGDFVPLRITFGSGESVSVEVPVVTNCGYYEGLDGTGGDCATSEPSTTSES